MISFNCKNVPGKQLILSEQSGIALVKSAELVYIYRLDYL